MDIGFSYLDAVHNVFIDECPNSGEDSEEDVITDYLGSSDCDRIPLINGDLGLNLRGNISTYTKDNTEKVITMSEVSEEQQQALSANSQTQPNPLVPIISVTPHSPGLAKNYPVLGKYIALNTILCFCD